MRVFVNSVPKSGTNLVAKLVRLTGMQDSRRSIASSSIVGRYQLIKSCVRIDHLSGDNVSVGLEFPVSVGYHWLNRYLKIDNNHYLSGHAAFSEQLAYLIGTNGVSHIQVFRHPAAVLLSWVKFFVEDINSWHPSHTIMKKMNLEDRCYFMLAGGIHAETKRYQNSFAEILRRSEGWLDGNALIVRYEDIVGCKGGGDDNIQRLTIARVMRHIGRPFSESDLDRMQEQLYGGTHTFRSGRVDGWTKEISQSVQELLSKELANSRLSRVLDYSLANTVE